VEDNWGAGTHLLLAEDTHTHFTASASLQVISDFPTPLPNLAIGTQNEPNQLNSPLNFGADVPEVNAIQSLLLRNTGGSWISWQATSDQPWLTLAPQQGVFQDSQGVFVAAERFHLAPGYHQGTITITSNAGKPIIIQAEVTVLAPPETTSALLVVEPPVLSFTATDGAASPAAQSLIISNPGTSPLNWSLTTGAPQDSLTPTINGQNDYAWLQTDSTSGVVAPGASARIQVMAQSQQLLPGVYGGILLFSVNGDPLVALQPVAVALTVQPRCGIIANPASISLTLMSGGQTPFDQPLAISTTPGCADATNWQAFPQVNWLKVTPASGQMQPGAIVKDTLEFDTSSLAPGTYTASVDLLTEMRSQTLLAQLIVLTSTATQPATVTPAPGTTSTVAPVTPTPLPQSCTLQVTPTSLAFTASFFQPNPPAQALTLSVTGNCSQHVTWTASVNAASQSWLHVGPTSGDIKGSGSTLVVQANAHHMMIGVYNGQITLAAVDHSGVPTQVSSQTVQVTLTVVF
jgi:hypothetical protein